MLGVNRADFRLLAGAELIVDYEAPIIERPPPYRTSFCRRCGSPVPNPDPAAEWFEIPAGLLDGDPELRPDKHIFVELAPAWSTIADDIPRFTKRELIEWRRRRHPAR